MTFHASKGLVGAEMRLDLQPVERVEPAESAADRDCSWTLRSTVDPRPGSAARSRATVSRARGLLDVTTQRRHRETRRVYDASGFHETRRERRRPPVTRRVDWPEGAVGRLPVVDGTALVLLASAHRLDVEGSLLRSLMPSRGRLLEVTCAATDLAQLRLAGESEPRLVRRVLITTTAQDPDALELAGLRGPIELDLELGTAIPLEIRGHVPKLGRVCARLVDWSPAGP